MALAARERGRREHNDRAWLAFNSATLLHQKPAKTLRDLQIRPPLGRSRQTPEDRLRMVRHLARTH